MAKLPVVVGFGGINAAGRGSFHHAYRRMVFDALPSATQQETLLDLATLMNLTQYQATDNGFLFNSHILSANDVVSELRHHILDNTLIRTIGEQNFDVHATPWQKNLSITPVNGEPIRFLSPKQQIPTPLPDGWSVQDFDEKQALVTLTTTTSLSAVHHREFPVQAGGSLPTGFNPSKLYQSRNHPRGLQMTVFAASDAIRSTGFSWQQILQHVNTDQVSVYAGSAMGQLDYTGFGGLLQARLLGKKVTSKQCPLGLAEMPADFVNAYITGTAGGTGSAVGACATFHYNLRLAINDIKHGKKRVAIVGTSEAPITPEAADGYYSMGALASDKALCQLDNTDKADHRRASRPFGDNCGFTLGESAQFVVLFDDSLALELGAQIHAAVPFVHVNADGFKKSISSPGVGNYITVAKAVANAQALLGEESIKKRSFMQAHGSSTPQNRVTESHILNEVAKTFGIESWPVSAIKSYLGHSIATAGGDQLNTSLGVWQYGLIPGIKTIDHVADDVFNSNLNIGSEDIEVGADGMDVAFLNAKGFGGNNATVTLLSPHKTMAILKDKHDKNTLSQYADKCSSVKDTAESYNQSSIKGLEKPVYLFDHQVVSGEDARMSTSEISLPGYENPIPLIDAD